MSTPKTALGLLMNLPRVAAVRLNNMKRIVAGQKWRSRLFADFRAGIVSGTYPNNDVLDASASSIKSGDFIEIMNKQEMTLKGNSGNHGHSMSQKKGR